MSKFGVRKHSVWMSTCSSIAGLVVHVLFLGSEIYVGCSNGQLVRYALQADDPNSVRQHDARLART